MFGNAAGVARATLGMNASDADVAQRVMDLGLDRPLLVQYGEWLRGVFTGDLGRSYFNGQPVTEALSTRMPVTLTLIVLTLVIMVVITVFLGVAAAYYGGWIDRVVQVLAGIGTAVPAFIVAVLLVLALAVQLPIFPATGYVRPTDSAAGWALSLVLPVTALLIGSISGSAAQVRGAMIDTLSKDFVRTLRARGMREAPIVFRHVLRTASGPVLISFGLTVIALFGGTVFVEQVFALPGMGQMVNIAAQQGDVPMVMGVVLVTIVIVLVVNVIVDLLNMVLNPKVRTR
jgi:peptide/nickel transport system permease protein